MIELDPYKKKFGQFLLDISKHIEPAEQSTEEKHHIEKTFEGEVDVVVQQPELALPPLVEDVDALALETLQSDPIHSSLNEEEVELTSDIQQCEPSLPSLDADEEYMVFDTQPSEQQRFATDKAKVEELTSSLLDNKPYMGLVRQCCDMIQELERMRKLVACEQTIGFIEQHQSRIAEALFLTGASPIAEEPVFNLLRHEPAEGGITTNGTPIAETIVPGIEIEGQVLVKAKVILKTEEVL